MTCINALCPLLPVSSPSALRWQGPLEVGAVYCRSCSERLPVAWVSDAWGVHAGLLLRRVFCSFSLGSFVQWIRKNGITVRLVCCQWWCPLKAVLGVF